MSLAIEIRTNEILFVVSKQRMNGQVEIMDSFDIQVENATNEEEFDLLDEVLTRRISHLLEERDVNERYATVVLNNRMGISRVLEIPKTKKKNMTNIARNELRSKLDLPADYVVDVMRLANFNKEGVPFSRVLAVGIQSEDIQKIEAWTKLFDLKLKSIQTGPAATITLLSQRSQVDMDKVTVFIDFTPSYFRIYMYKGNEYLFMRTLSNPRFKHMETNERFLSILKVLSLKLEAEYGYGVSELLILAKVENLDRHREFFMERANLMPERFNIDEVIKVSRPENDELHGFMNAIGALV